MDDDEGEKRKNEEEERKGLTQFVRTAVKEQAIRNPEDITPQLPSHNPPTETTGQEIGGSVLMGLITLCVCGGGVASWLRILLRQIKSFIHSVTINGFFGTPLSPNFQLTRC